MMTMKSLYIRTLGCQMNERDAEALTGLFKEDGYALTDDLEQADVILLVTCSVRLGAEDKAVSFMQSLSGMKKKRPHVVIGFLGCAAKNRGEEIKATMPHVDIVAGPAEVDKVISFVRAFAADRNIDKTVLALEDRARDEAFYSTTHADDPERAQVVISMGCDNWCTYCIVPYVRGSLRHRAPDAIIAEVRAQIAAGRRKITLLGQNVNDYFAPGNTSYDFVALLKDVAAIDGAADIDFTSSHPRNQSVELFSAMAALPNVRKHLHMAMQSGSTRVLEAMNRGYTKEHLLHLIAEFKRITGGTIGTDIIVGFPGETEADFEETIDVVTQARFDYAFIFMYSPRPHSKAYDMVDDVSLETKKARHARLLALQKSISAEKRQTL
jgi:tRNA-2-methylthio-N6-dimethylallyladenosine synthase